MSYSRTTWSDGSTALSAEHMNNIEDGINEALEGIAGVYASQSLFDAIYPVGSIYMSVNSANPGTLFGGTWVAWGSGRVPVGVDTSQSSFDTVEETGGSVTHTHTNPSTGGSSAANTGGTTLTAAQSGTQAQTITTGNMSQNSSVNGSASFRLWGSDGGSPILKTTGVLSTSPGSVSQALTFESGSDKYPLSQDLVINKSIEHAHSVSVAAKNATTAHSHNMEHTHSQGNTGSASTLQPYITCYMWKRTA